MTLTNIVLMVIALAGLLLGMSGFLLGKRALKKARQTDELSHRQSLRPFLNGHSSIDSWRRAADESKQASERRRLNG
jgi:hypothetical protein